MEALDIEWTTMIGHIGSGGGEDYAAVAARLNSLMAKPRLTGREIREIVFQVLSSMPMQKQIT